MERSWQIIRSEKGPRLPLFQVRYDWVRNPRNGRITQAVILESQDWVNVVAVTPEMKIVVVKQHRFGVQKPTTEIPAGMVEPGEAPEAAARRELEEETGYATNDWKYLGWVEANPAFLDNHCHQWLARGVVRTRQPKQDEGEDISVSELSLEEMRREISEGRLRNSLALLALTHVFDIRAEAERRQYPPF